MHQPSLLPTTIMSAYYPLANTSVQNFLTEVGFDDMAAWKKYSETTFRQVFAETKQKKVKREGEPKKATSAFFLYSAEHRQKIKDANPGLPAGDLAKKIGELWKAESDRVKAPYKAKEQALKVQYTEDLAAFIEEHGPAPKTVTVTKIPRVSKPKKIKDPNAPKPAKNSYTIFCADLRRKSATKHPALTPEEMKAKLKETWAALKKGETAEEKATFEKYEALAKVDKERYNAENAIYKAKKEGKPVAADAESDYGSDAETEAPRDEDAPDFDTMSNLELMHHVVKECDKSGQAVSSKTVRLEFAEKYGREISKEACKELAQQYRAWAKARDEEDEE